MDPVEDEESAENKESVTIDEEKELSFVCSMRYYKNDIEELDYPWIHLSVVLFLGQLWRVSTFLLCVVNRNDDQGNMAEILADGQVSQDRSYIHLRQTKGYGYGIKEILYHNSSCFT